MLQYLQYLILTFNHVKLRALCVTHQTSLRATALLASGHNRTRHGLTRRASDTAQLLSSFLS